MTAIAPLQVEITLNYASAACIARDSASRLPSEAMATPDRATEIGLLAKSQRGDRADVPVGTLST
jgi:hypothetical protein